MHFFFFFCCLLAHMCLPPVYLLYVVDSKTYRACSDHLQILSPCLGQGVHLKSLIKSLLDPHLNQKLFWQRHLADHPKALICAPRREDQRTRSNHWGAMSEDTRVHPLRKSPSSTIRYTNSASRAVAFERGGAEAIQVSVASIHFCLCIELIQLC